MPKGRHHLTHDMFAKRVVMVRPCDNDENNDYDGDQSYDDEGNNDDNTYQ